MFSFLCDWAVRLWVVGLSFHEDDLESPVETFTIKRILDVTDQ